MKQLVLSFPNSYELFEYLSKNEVSNMEVHSKTCNLIGFFTDNELDIALKVNGAEVVGTLIEINSSLVSPL